MYGAVLYGGNSSMVMIGDFNKPVRHSSATCITASKQICQLVTVGFGVTLQCAASTGRARQLIDSFVW